MDGVSAFKSLVTVYHVPCILAFFTLQQIRAEDICQADLFSANNTIARVIRKSGKQKNFPSV